MAASEAKFATAFNLSPLILTITSLTDGRLLEVNEGFVRTTGYTRAEALGRTPDELGLWANPQERMTRLAKVKAGEWVTDLEERLRIQNGELKTCLFSAALMTINGQPCILTTLTDITERKQAEAALQANERQLSLITDNVSGLISFVDRAECYGFVNAIYEQWFGQSREQIVGRTVQEVLGDAAYAVVQPRIVQALAGERITFENTIAYPDGITRTVLTTYVPAINDQGLQDGQIVGFYALVTDITSRKQAEERLHLLAEASRVLASSLDYTATLQNVARAAVPGLADWCMMSLIQEDGSLQEGVIAHVDPAQMRWAAELHKRYPLDRDAPSGTAQVLRTGQAELYPEITDAMLQAVAQDAEQLALLRAAGYRSAMVVPLKTNEHILGAITFIATAQGRVFDTEDLTVAEELAQRAAIAIRNAQLHRAVQHREQALRSSEERLRLATEAGKIGTYDHDLRTQRTIFSDIYLTITGVKADELLTREAWLMRVHPADCALVAEKLERAVACGESYDYEYRIYRPDGALRWLSASSRVTLDETGRAIRMTGVVRDITERKQAEESLRESEERFRSAFEQAAVGMAHLDVNGRYVRVNDRLCALLGYARTELLQRTFLELTHPEDRANGLALSKSLLAGKVPSYSTEKRYLCRDGSVTWVNVTASVVRDAQSDVKYQQVVIEDIAARKTAEDGLRELTATLEQRVAARTDELARSNRELDQFAYVASHDLKAPLRAIGNLAGWIAEDAGTVLPSPSLVHLQKLQGRVLRMERLLDDLLTYSRIGRRDGTSETVNTEVLLQDILYLLAPPPGFAVTVMSELPVLHTLRTPLELVLRNLISNAIKHHHQPQQGAVQIQARDSGDFVEFQIYDNGPGIDPKYHERIFGMFQTLRPRDEVEGSGMGLAIVKRAVEYHGGAIQVESSLGTGTTFRFTWPKQVVKA